MNNNKIVHKQFIVDGEIDLLEGLQIDFTNYQNLANVLLDNNNLSVELFEEIKKVYLETGYKLEIAKSEISKKYKPDNIPYSRYYINFETKEIVYYEQNGIQRSS